MQQQNGRFLFEIEGKRRRRFLKRLQNRIVVYENAIHVTVDDDSDTCTKEDIFDIYIKEPVVDGVDCRMTLIEFYRESRECAYDLGDDIFPGLAKQMEYVLKNEWSHLLKKHDYPQTVKWFVACCAVVQIVSQKNPHIFGSACKGPQSTSGQREELRESWGFNDRRDLLRMLPDLLGGRSVRRYSENAGNLGETGMEEIGMADGERCLWAWDLQRLILLSALGYVCDWLSWEEALDWCLKAGQKLQGMYKNWDDFMGCYLKGYSHWTGEDLEDKNSQAYERKQAYEHYKKLPDNPWSVRWDFPLSKEW